MTHKNLSCYNNYEQFDDYQKEEEYKKSKLYDCNKHVNFINKIFSSKKIKVVELGSGNSKFLYNLSLNNLLDVGYAFEISKSRHEFAEKWKTELKVKNVRNILDNFLNVHNYDFKNIDLVFISDLAFQFCEPIESGSDSKLLEHIYKILKFDGVLVLELDGCKNLISSYKTNNKKWEEFKDSDPWQYSLWEYTYDETKKLLNWDKIFIHRHKNIKDFSSVVLKIYEQKEIEELLLNIGFKKITFFQDWYFEKMYDDGKEFILIAEK